MPSINELSPSAGWPGGTRMDGTRVNGTLVIIRGTEFHPTPEMDRNQVTFAGAGGSRIAAPVEWASFNEVDYEPDGVVARDTTVPGGLDSPAGIAVDAQGTMFIADTSQHRIVRMTAAGAFSSFGSQGIGNGEFSHPSGVAVDSNGFVYVADSGNHRIQKFDNNGAFVTAWGTQGAGIGEFDWPVAVDVAEFAGLTLVYVADSNNHRVQRSGADGELPTQLLTPADSGRILGVSAPRPYGFCYATDAIRRRIYRWPWTGGLVAIFGSPQQVGDVEAHLDFPMGIAQDFDGFVYVADQGARIVRKFDPFDPAFREVSRFGLTIPNVPQPTPEDQFVDPVDIAVTDLKAAVVVDRQRARAIRYVPADAQQIWVHVPEGAETGLLEVRTDQGAASASFSVFQRADVEIDDAYLVQQLVEHPFVAGKDTVLRYQFRTVNATELHNFSWGSPVHDSAVCQVARDGQNVGSVEATPHFITGSGGFLTFEIAFELHFKIPFHLISEPGHYTFDVVLDRSGTPAFHDGRRFDADFVNRRRYRIVNAPISHLNVQGQRVRDFGNDVALFAMDPQRSLDWLDVQQLYSGYAHYNRMYPLRHSFAEIEDYYTWIYGGLEDGVSGAVDDNDEVEYMLGVLERTRRRLNEDASPDYDYMLGTLARDEIREDDDGERFIGLTTDAGRCCLISVGINPFLEEPAFDVGGIIAHELLHQHGVDHQTDHEIAPSESDAWDAITGFFVRDPATLMFVGTDDNPNTVTRFDFNVFAEPLGEYDVVFDALANPHPSRPFRRERRVDSESNGPARPPGAERNFSLIGWISRNGTFARTDSWLGSTRSPVTPSDETGDAELIFIDAAGRELLRWGLHVSFGLREIRQDGRTRRREARRALISVTTPFPDATATVILVHRKQPVWEARVPSQPPSLRLIAPTGPVPQGEPLRVAWTSATSETEGLRTTVSVTTDGGRTYRPVALGIRGTELELTDLASASGLARVRVGVSDGFNEVAVESDEIVVGNVPTRLAIIQPWRGAIVPQGQPLRMTAMAINADTGPVSLTAGNTIWDLDGEVILGSGTSIEVREIPLRTPRGDLLAPLPVGPHALRVRVQLGPGQILTDEIPIEVVADSDRDGVPDDVERERGTSPTDPGDGAAHAPAVPFGQWSFDTTDQWTLYEIGHLGSGTARIEVGFRSEDGTPLARHPVVLTPGAAALGATDDRGWIRLTLGPFASIKVQLGSTTARGRGFGISYARLASGSPMHDTRVLGHAWIVARSREGDRVIAESQGTVVIQGGGPIRLRGPAPRPPTVTASTKPPPRGHRTLGFLRMARSRAPQDVAPLHRGPDHDP